MRSTRVLVRVWGGMWVGCEDRVSARILVIARGWVWVEGDTGYR